MSRGSKNHPAVFWLTDYVFWGSKQNAGIARPLCDDPVSRLLPVRLSDDLFKRKLVEIIGGSLNRQKITVDIFNQIAGQIERFLLV